MALAVATAVSLTVFGALVAGCSDDTSSTSGNSAGECVTHTVDFQGVIYYQYSSRPTPVKYGKKLGTGDEYIHCDDALAGPTGDASLTRPKDKTTPVAIYAIDNLAPARAVAADTETDGVVMLVPAEGKRDQGLKKYAHN